MPCSRIFGWTRTRSERQIAKLHSAEWRSPIATRRARLLPVPQYLEEPDDRLNPTIEVRDVELFVGSVQVVVGQAHAHHDAGNLQVFVELSDDGNGAAGADVHRVLPKHLVHGFD